jgi:sugar O-acyltransferase (sialic acid O-acetyltransferase NeuD family)
LSPSKKLLIVGAGEFAQIAFEYFKYDSEYEVCGFAVESLFLDQVSLCDLPVVPFETIDQLYPPADYDVFVAVTQTKLNRIRRRLFTAVKQKGYQCATYISSQAFVWRNATIGENCFIFEMNAIQPFVTIEDNVVLWSGNHIGHRSIVEKNSFISSHVVVAGFSRIGHGSFLGINSSIVDNVIVAPDNLIAAGAVVTKNTEPGLIYRGNPASPEKVTSYRYFGIESDDA